MIATYCQFTTCFKQKSLDEANHDPVIEGTYASSIAIEYLPVKLS
jgi:hypothetical protein